MQANKYHSPVLLNESIDALNIKPDGIYVDATFGGGGHSLFILSKLNEKGKLFVFDVDKDAQKNMPTDARITFINANFKYLERMLKLYEVNKIDGLLADLGVSSYQINTPERGFSIRYNSSLDMRMNQNSTLLAKDIINNYSENDLCKIFSKYSQIHNSKTLARTIVNNRKLKKIDTTDDLKSIIIKVAKHANNINRYLAQVFQALRIELNQELEALKELLQQCEKLIVEGGRLAIISYHSEEDKLVKYFINKGCFYVATELKDAYGNPLIKYPFKSLYKKPVIPTKEEIESNNRSRSAKLRVGVKIS